MVKDAKQAREITLNAGNNVQIVNNILELIEGAAKIGNSEIHLTEGFKKHLSMIKSYFESLGFEVMPNYAGRCLSSITISW